ncbi:MAG: HDOD domain-containing protein [Propionivibrio sp.]|uniref:HDOD domain-containing protein n=1 Tax=Candidatus Propionivibrio dominans TaxID=2954373 RepID=A0A9D7IGD6_9RHOO|nr:HDOD domain-containing protein [Candidatus Propionivibrio dominans]MBL0168262.1 HDOD domain-containing protein [Propionivibrio sp.]
MDSWKSRWGVGQWAAYFENQALPVMCRSKLLMKQLESREGEMLAPRDLSEIVLQDPLLCLCLLREAERKKSHRLDHETTTALGAIMQVGVDEFRTLLHSSPEIDENKPGLLEVEMHACFAAQIASVWAGGRMDLNPEEVAVAALLAGTGELLLWVYAEEIPLKAMDELLSGRAQRSAQAQTQSCGFTFKQLTQQCAERWKLPALLLQLLRGSESYRAQLARTCSNAARHVLEASGTSTLALAADLVDASKLIPNVSLEWLADGLVMLPEERRAGLLEAAHKLLAAPP